MGYYFSLEHANLLANLIDGNSKRIKMDIEGNEESRQEFIELMIDMKNNLISTNPHEYKIMTSLILEKMGYDDGNHLKDYSNIRLEKSDRYHNSRRNYFRIEDLTVFELIDELSKALKKFDYKFLILKERNESEKLLEHIVEKYHYSYSALFLQPQDLQYDNYGLLNSFPHFEKTLLNINRWPGVLIWKNKSQAFFVKLTKRRTLKHILEQLDKFGEEVLTEMQAEDSERKANYIFHFSDLHIGASNIQRKLNRLKKIYRSKLEEIEGEAEIDFVITGDSVDEPTEAAIQCLEGFVDDIISDNGKAPHIILGNHDIDKHGFALSDKNRITTHNAISIIGQEPIKIKNKILLIPFNSNTRDKHAKGMIGEEQFSVLGNRLDSIPYENEHLKIAILHHHIAPIPNPDWRKIKWYEKLFPSRIEDSLKLIDADSFKEWAESREIKIILHGHKHIPFYDDTTVKDAIVVSCGSSTGKIDHIESGKTYLSYNLLKITDDNIVVNQYVEELLGSGTSSILTKSVSR